MQSQAAQLHKPQKLYAITPLKKLILDGLAQQLLIPHPFNHIQAIKDALYSITDQHEPLVVTPEDMRYITTTYAQQLAKASEPLPLYAHTGVERVISNTDSANVALPALAAVLDLKNTDTHVFARCKEKQNALLEPQGYLYYLRQKIPTSGV